MGHVKEGVGLQFLKDSGFIIDTKFYKVRGLLRSKERKASTGSHPRATVADLVVHPGRTVGQRYIQDSGLVKHEDFDAVMGALQAEKAKLTKKFGKELSAEDMEAAGPFDN